MMRKSTLFTAVGSAVTLTAGMRLESRAAQTSALCTQSFAWMQNSKGDSPCQVAASVDALCNNGNWVIGALNASVTYQNPTGPTATLCTCSWASYNLLSACTACQGFPEQIPQWTVFSSGCANMLTNTFFPANLTLPPNVAIPAWAQEDPTKWDAETFSVPEAQATAAKFLPDFVGGTAPTHKKSSIGAIVGGVLGGIIVLAGAVIVAFWMIRRKRQETQAASGTLHHPGHMRQFSDMSAASNVKSENGPYNMMSTTQASPTINSSLRSFPFFRIGGVSSPPPAPIRQAASPPIPAEDIVVPFTLPPTVDNPDRKQANGPQPIYDHPFAPPPMRVDSTRPTTPSRERRYNPPPYTPSSPGGSSSGQHAPRHAGKQPSTDTQHSLPSQTHSPNTSGSGRENIIGQVERANAAPAERSVHGRQLSSKSRDEKRRPSDGMISASDIA